MDDRKSLAQQLETLVTPLLADHDVELVELTCHPQGKQWLIRFLVDTVGGVTIKRCAQLNRLIGEVLESSDLIDGSYTLEVSSPGLDRPLVSLKDFERALGEDLQLEVIAQDGKTAMVKGMLLAVQPEAIVLKTADGKWTIALKDIRRAVKAIRW